MLIWDITLGNSVSAEVIDSLTVDFNDNDDLPTALSLVADAYWNHAFRKIDEGDPNGANECFQMAITQWKRVIDRFPRIPQVTAGAYYFSGCCYERLGQTDKALEHYLVVVERWPDYEYAWSAQFSIACCLEEMTRAKKIPFAEGVEKIKEACRKLLASYPDCMAAGSAQNMLGQWERIKQNTGEKNEF